MNRINLEAPWNTYQKKVKALFERDPEITVGDVVRSDSEDFSYEFDLEVRNHDKFVALDRVLPSIVEFGNVTLGINLIDADTEKQETAIDIFKAIFAGNNIVKDYKEVQDPTGGWHAYVCFWPEVIQFFNDDTSDCDGKWSGLAQDIAREVFAESSWGVNFCTASVRENASAN